MKILVFGKRNCPLCERLDGKLEQLKDTHEGLEIRHLLLDNDDAVVEFCKSHLNGSKIPALLACGEDFSDWLDARTGDETKTCRTFPYAGLQTDKREISYRMLEDLLADYGQDEPVLRCENGNCHL